MPLIFLTLRVYFGQTQWDVLLSLHHCKQRCGNFVQLLRSIESVHKRPIPDISIVVIFSSKHSHACDTWLHWMRFVVEYWLLQSLSDWHFVPIGFS
jgi:hypothetical protein